MGDCGGKSLGAQTLQSENRYFFFWAYTLPKTNIAPENGWLKDESSYWGPAYV